MQQQQFKSQEHELIQLFRAVSERQRVITLGMLRHCLAPRQAEQIGVIVTYPDSEPD